MAGQPKRRAAREALGLPVAPRQSNTPIPAHVLTAEDQVKAQAVLRVKRELRKRVKVETEQQLQDALKAHMDRVLGIQDRLLVGLEAMASNIENGTLDKDDVPLLKTLLAEQGRNIDRVFGKSTQRQVIDSHSTSTHIDVAELMRGGQKAALPAPADFYVDGEVLDDDEEIFDGSPDDDCDDAGDHVAG